MDLFQHLREAWNGFWQRLRPNGPARSSEPQSPFTVFHEETDTAHHEAGHAIIAWFSPHVSRIDEITIKPSLGRSGFVQHATLLSGTAGQIYDQVVINLGGLAGVLTRQRRIRSRYFLTDLQAARAWAETLADDVVDLPLRQTSKRIRFDVGRFFREPPTPRAAMVLNDALEEARARIDRHRDPFRRLVAALLRRKRLTENDLPAILGPRPWAPLPNR